MSCRNLKDPKVLLGLVDAALDSLSHLEVYCEGDIELNWHHNYNSRKLQNFQTLRAESVCHVTCVRMCLYMSACACLSVTSSVGGVHSVPRQTELAEEGSELPGGQGTAEHTHGLQEQHSHTVRRLKQHKVLIAPPG